MCWRWAAVAATLAVRAGHCLEETWDGGGASAAGCQDTPSACRPCFLPVPLAPCAHTHSRCAAPSMPLRSASAPACPAVRRPVARGPRGRRQGAGGGGGRGAHALRAPVGGLHGVAGSGALRTQGLGRVSGTVCMQGLGLGERGCESWSVCLQCAERERGVDCGGAFFVWVRCVSVCVLEGGR